MKHLNMWFFILGICLVVSGCVVETGGSLPSPPNPFSGDIEINDERIPMMVTSTWSTSTWEACEDDLVNVVDINFGDGQQLTNVSGVAPIDRLSDWRPDDYHLAVRIVFRGRELPQMPVPMLGHDSGCPEHYSLLTSVATLTVPVDECEERMVAIAGTVDVSLTSIPRDPESGHKGSSELVGKILDIEFICGSSARRYKAKGEFVDNVQLRNDAVEVFGNRGQDP